MTVKINTKDGQIELTDEVIATVVGGATTEIFGVVGMASKNALKDNFQALLGKENYSKGVVVKAAEAVIMQYTGYDYVSNEDAPTYA